MLTYAAHMLQLFHDTTYENQPAKDRLTVLIYALKNLLQDNRTPSLITRVFALKTVQLMGFVPFLSGCCLCGTREIDDIYFSFDRCGFVCEKCNTGLKNVIQVKAGTAKALIYVLCAEPRKAFGFELSPDVLKNFTEIVDRYVDDRLEKKYSKMNFFQEVQENSR